ncbi:MAG: tRNA uridine-5-carboxymethylaminomethyl(34) synthesis GTPase MnmE [Gemmatimonas sp.]|nr:tRNA uridine-5-carboxymethylaminomethyl(34) synthesis GTPase MnmE [Gemmatimonadaceae bacterium]
MSRVSLSGLTDTIVAQATAGARSALAVIRISGPDAHKIGATVLQPWRATPNRAYLAVLCDPDSGREIDQGIITVFTAPASFTGEDMLELSLHGGEIGPSLALNAVLSCGARLALPGEFTRRALMHGKLDLLQAEGIADLVDSRSRAMHDVALGQVAGHLSKRLNALREQIIELEALLAYDVDFPEEDNGPITLDRIERAARDIAATIDALLETTATSEMIRSGAVVVIAGAPNTGKSSLFNALAGTERAIVTDIPGTTRDALEAMMDMGPWPVRLIDTAGLRSSSDIVERLGIEVAEQYLKSAQIVLVCSDDASSLSIALERVRALASGSILAVGTKCDLGGLPVTLDDGLAYVRVSARTGEGLGELVQRITELLNREHEPTTADNPLLTRERHRVALTKARAEISAFLEQCVSRFDLPATVAAVHLHSARGHLEELVGAVDVEDVLDRVFSAFCIGK